MDGLSYQGLAMRTNDGKSGERLSKRLKLSSCPDIYADVGGVLNACLGLSGEVGEFNDMIKKWVFHEKPLDEDHAEKELGDICWYIALVCDSFGWDLNKILADNIAKLKLRYPEGFDVERSNNRKEGDV